MGECESQRVTVLELAVRGGFRTIVELLLDCRAELTSRTGSSWCLHDATRAGHAQVCEALLQHRADADATNRDGQSALHLAADPVTIYGNSSGKIEVIRKLLEYNANPNAYDAAGQTALEIAEVTGFEEAEELLYNAAV